MITDNPYTFTREIFHLEGTWQSLPWDTDDFMNDLKVWEDHRQIDLLL